MKHERTCEYPVFDKRWKNPPPIRFEASEGREYWTLKVPNELRDVFISILDSVAVLSVAKKTKLPKKLARIIRAINKREWEKH